MPYIYDGPVVPAPAATLPASDPAWTNYWNYQTALFRQADMVAREAANAVARTAADAQAKLAGDVLKPVTAAPLTRAQHVAALAEAVQARNPALTGAAAVRAAEQFFTSLGFFYPNV